MPKHREVVQNLVCECGAKIIKDGRLTCPRCHQSVDMALESNVVIDEQGRWKCQKCLEHGKRPRTLAVGDKIECRKCRIENSLIREEEKMAIRDVEFFHRETVEALERLRVASMRLRDQWKDQRVRIVLNELEGPGEIIGKIIDVKRVAESSPSWFSVVVENILEGRTEEISVAFIKDIHRF